jgi:hypothetical protein
VEVEEVYRAGRAAEEKEGEVRQRIGVLYTNQSTLFEKK